MCFAVIPKQAFGFVGLVLQTLGVAIVLGSNLSFWYRAGKAYGSVKKYAFDTACAVLCEEPEVLKKLPGLRRISRRNTLSAHRWLSGYIIH